MKNLKNKLAISSAALIIGAGSLVGAGGCGQQVQDAFYNDPLNSAVISTMPRFLQPGGYRDAQERKRVEETYQQSVQSQQTEYRSIGIFNLEKELPEIEMPGWDYIDYILKQSKNNNFSKKGYIINELINGRTVNSYKIVLENGWIFRPDKVKK